MKEIFKAVYKYIQNCIERSPLGQGGRWLYKTGDLLKEARFVRIVL